MFKEFFSEAFPIIEKAAPSIASAIGSPVAGIASMFGVNLLAQAFGINPSNIKNLSSAIVSHPDVEPILSDLEKQFSDWFKNNSGTLRLPNKLELNVKMEWDNAQG